jgi:RNA polymerase sigma-70 factor (ECF subfamily)
MLAAEVHGARAVAETFLGKAGAARLALIGGRLGATWAPGGKPMVVFCFTTQLDRITEIKLVADPESISDLQVAVLGRHLPGGEPGES